MTSRYVRWGQFTLLSASFALLASCGGGGGGAPDNTPPPVPASYTISGKLSLAANLVLDSDTNDPNQTPRKSNDDFDIAQPITASSQVLGTVNVVNAGPAGASRTAGDDFDLFKVTVAAGQTIELDFTADPAVNDVDLYIFQLVGGVQTQVGESIDINRSECVTITSAGEYTVIVNAFSGASLYNLRVTAAGAANTCQNATITEAGVQRLRPGEVIVGLDEGSARAQHASALMAREPLRVLRGAVQPGRLALLGLPDDNRLRVMSAGSSRGSALRRGLGADALRQFDTIAYAKTLRASGAFDQVMLNRVLRTSTLVAPFPPNDTRYPLQRWHYEQISLPTAMNQLAALTVQPTQRPIVAVVDTGIVADHPDLAPQIVDGYDFIRDAASGGDGNGIDPNPDDLQSRTSQPSFHGTHVAGTIAAATFDGSGAAGVAPMAQIMALRVLGEGGSGSFYDIVQAIRYASGQSNDAGRLPARRADVVNLSLGAQGISCDSDTTALFASVRAAGTLVVAASGNESNRPQGQLAPVGYPANCAGVYAVTATDPQRAISYYANTGSAIAMAAPGGDMRNSTTGTGQPDGVYSTLATFDAGGTRVPTFGVLQGTSMATPHAAGMLALMRWVYPAITPAQVDALLANGSLTDDAGAAGKDPLYGYGVVNAAKAVQAALTLRDGTAPPIAGVLEAQPAALDFGLLGTTLDFTVRATGSTSETVVSTATSTAGVTVAALSVDTATGLGSYRISVDRNQLALGVNTPTVTVQTTARTLTVQLSIEKRAPGATIGGDLGPVYVMVYNAADNALLKQITVQASAGAYNYSLGGLKPQSIYIVAGTDYDNDGFICSRGEACGAYPVLGAQVTPIMLDSNLGGLDFVLSPVGAGNAASSGTGSSGTASWRRLNF